MGTDDSADDSAVTELENEITMQDEKIAELEAEVATLTTQHQDAMAELNTVQSTLQTTQTSLDSAEANATMHQAEIFSLEAERDMAQAEISMLYELMSNMSDQSNETFENMASQFAELNQHMSNLSLMLNESYDRHQENSTLAAGYFSQIQSLSFQLQEMIMLLNSKNASLDNSNRTIRFFNQFLPVGTGLEVAITNCDIGPSMCVTLSNNMFDENKIFMTNFDFNSSALFLVLLLILILETFILFKAKIIDGTTPPAPKIKIFLFLKFIIQIFNII